MVLNRSEKVAYILMLGDNQILQTIFDKIVLCKHASLNVLCEHFNAVHLTSFDIVYMKLFQNITPLSLTYVV